MPIRKIPNNYRSITGTLFSLKNNHNIMYESLLERDFYLTLEFDSAVKGYEEQPIQLQYLKNNISYRYTPDALVHYHDEYEKLPCIYEVKYSDEIREKRVLLKEKFEQIEIYLANNDMNFKLFTEIDISPIYLENIRFIYGYVSYSDEIQLKYTLSLIKNYHLTYEEILLSHSTNKIEQAKIIPYIWKLVLLNLIQIDLHQPINKLTKLKRL